MITPTAPVRALKSVRWWLRRRGWDVVHYGGGLARVQQEALASQGIDVVVDVGANEGQYAQEMRLRGYRGDILSIEPGSAAHDLLQRQAASDPGWSTVRAAVGATSGTARLGVSENLQSSSLLPVSTHHLGAAPNAAFVEHETVDVLTLDSLDLSGRRVWLKLDCQGSEHAALDGASSLMADVRVIQCEMSLVPMYDGESSIAELLPRLVRAGFEPWWIEPGFLDPSTGAALQVEVLLVRSGHDV